MNKPLNPTIKYIAKSLQVSSATVSRALNDYPYVQEDTRKKILDLAKSLDYEINVIARSLKKRKSHTIGVIVPDISISFFSQAISGMEKVAYKAGYSIIVSQTHENLKREIQDTKTLMSSRVDGLIVSVSSQTCEGDHFLRLQKQGIPVVFFDRVCEKVKASKVIADDFGGAFRAVEHLIQTGFKKIAHFAGPEHLSMSKNRCEGYISALEKYNRPVKKELIVHGGFDEEAGKSAFHKLRQQNIFPDAVFAINDWVAIGAYKEIKALGMKIPDDIGLMGFSDSPTSYLLDPPLSSVTHPAMEMGEKSAQLLIEQIDHKSGKFKPQICVIKTALKIKDSSIRHISS
jgi:LacI family transcriptional regulator